MYIRLQNTTIYFNCTYAKLYVTGNYLYVKEAEDFFEQICVEDFNTKEDVIFWKQVLNEIRYNTSFFQDVWDGSLFDQTDITMYLMSHCKVSTIAHH